VAFSGCARPFLRPNRLTLSVASSAAAAMNCARAGGAGGRRCRRARARREPGGRAAVLVRSGARNAARHARSSGGQRRCRLPQPRRSSRRRCDKNTGCALSPAAPARRPPRRATLPLRRARQPAHAARCAAAARRSAPPFSRPASRKEKNARHCQALCASAC
jgi:hypothetical protein